MSRTVYGPPPESSSADTITPNVEVPEDIPGRTPGADGPPKVGPTPRKSSSTARKRAADTPPKRKPPKPNRQQIATQQIEDALAQILTFPAVPCLLAGDQWASEHFATQGRAFAKNLAELSERNPAIRRWCERLMEGESVAVLAMSGVMYALPPLMHWGLLPAPVALRSAFGVPESSPVAPGDDTAAQAEAHQSGNTGNGYNGHRQETYQGHDGAQH